MINEELLTPEFIERIKQRDQRFRDIDLRLQIEQELRDNVSLKIVLEAISEQAAEALEALAIVAPNDLNRIVFLQATVQRARIIAKTLNTVIRRGEIAEANINEEQQLENDITKPYMQGIE